MVQIKKNRLKSYFLVAWRELAVIAAVLFLDLFTKFLINKNMNLHEKKVLIKNFFNFFYTLNTEAAVGFDFWLGDKLGVDGLRILFIVFVSVAVAVFAFFLVRGHKDSFLFRLPLALIIGGALGNLYDRIFHRAVRDFIHFEFFGKEIFGYTYFPTFNLADSALVIGVILFMVYFIFFDAKFQKRKEQLKAEKTAVSGENGAETEDSAAEKGVSVGDKNTSVKTEVAKATVNGGSVGAAESETATTDKNAVNNATITDKTALNNADITDKTTKKAVDITDNASATMPNDTAEKMELIAGDDGARAVEVLGKRNYAKKIVTETIVTETIITETTTAKKDNSAAKYNAKDTAKDTGTKKDSNKK